MTGHLPIPIPHKKCHNKVMKLMHIVEINAHCLLVTEQ